MCAAGRVVHSTARHVFITRSHLLSVMAHTIRPIKGMAKDRVATTPTTYDWHLRSSEMIYLSQTILNNHTDCPGVKQALEFVRNVICMLKLCKEHLECLLIDVIR